jgi:hypothetical protein
MKCPICNKETTSTVLDYSELDNIIQQNCSIPDMYDDGSTLDESKYNELSNEINDFVHRCPEHPKDYKLLTNDAQEIMDEWERAQNELRGA